MFIINLLQQKKTICWGAEGVLPKAQELGSTWVSKKIKKKKTEFAKLKDPKGYPHG